MLKSILDESKASGEGPTQVLQRQWGSLLSLRPDACSRFCSEAEAYLEPQRENTPSRKPVEQVFFNVACAALYAIHAGLATPLAWGNGAYTSRFRSTLPAAVLSTMPANAAAVMVRFCEQYLLASPHQSRQIFESLLTNTGMGVPLLSLVLDAYGTAVVHVLAREAPGTAAAAVDACLSHLHAATEVYAIVDGMENQLTVAHPALLHVARVSGRAEEGLRFFQQHPIRTVNPILSGVGLADYAAYYAEAALLLSSMGRYESALYVLACVHSLPQVVGLNGRSRPRGGGAAAAILLSAGAAADEDDDRRLPSIAGSKPQAGTHARAAAVERVVAPACISLYPWYRTRPVSTSHFTHSIIDRRGEAPIEEVVEWRLMLAPSTAEKERDRCTRAWAGRLGLALLALAFGSGNPREVERADWCDVQITGREPNWAGVNSAAIKGHVCFPHPLFSHLSQTTLMSLSSVATAAADSSEAELAVYRELLMAVAARNVEQAKKLLQQPAANQFATDLTSSLTRAAVHEYLPRHVLLDAARLYSHVPLRLLLTRASLGLQDNNDAARTLLSHVAQLCAMGVLETAQVCTSSGEARDVQALVASSSFESSTIDTEAASVKWVAGSPSRVLETCARIVLLQPLTEGGDPAPQCSAPAHNGNAQLLSMLIRLQELQQAVDLEHEAVQALR